MGTLEWRYWAALFRRADGPVGGGTGASFAGTRIARHEAATRDRDFIVGDLHGCLGPLDSPGALELTKPWGVDCDSSAVSLNKDHWLTRR